MKISILITAIIACAALYITTQTTQVRIEDPRTITVWVHGTKLTPTIAFSNFFYRLPGMNSAISYDAKYHKRSTADLLCKVAAQDYTLEDFYFFGWNGRLSFQEREKASKDLYHALLQLVSEYETKYGCTPRIRMISHSHGGNVVLNLAKVQDTEHQIMIDELILLCCPVQEKTKHNIEHSCFKKIYSFYSSSDMFQIIDPQGLYKESCAKKTFSERRFDYHDKVRQSCVKINGRSLMHIDFLLSQFVAYLPTLCRELDQFYETVSCDQTTYEKIINIQIHKNRPVRFDRKLKVI